MTEQSGRNVFLVLILLGLRDTNPLRPAPAPSDGGPRRLQEDKPYSLLVGLLDPADSRTSTAIAPVELTAGHKRHYNKILDQVEGLFAKYDSPAGFVHHPATFTQDAQRSILEQISLVGQKIYQLLLESPVRPWLEPLLESEVHSQNQSGVGSQYQHVTIITNEFDIPWYWMKAKDWTRMLCEVCSLGMLQLSSDSSTRALAGVSDASIAEVPQGQEPFRALLIGGSSDDGLPFLENELAAVQEALQVPIRTKPALESDHASSREELINLAYRYDPTELRRLHKIVHYAGHWDFSSDALVVDGKKWHIKHLENFVGDSVLALDGCSSSRGLRAWADVQGLTAAFLSLGALGCIVTVLPVKNDPIAAEIFWGTYYKELRMGATIGHALYRGRQKLITHFRSLGLDNPAWALYQLIGNPSVEPFPSKRPLPNDG